MEVNGCLRVCRRNGDVVVIQARNSVLVVYAREKYSLRNDVHI